MRRFVILIVVLCSTISGWTPVLAQVQKLHGLEATVNPSSAGKAEAAADEDCRDHDGSGNSCCGQQIHPMLCAACFAIEATAPALFTRVSLVVLTLSSQQQAMEDSVIEPVHPPPKA